MHLFITFEKLGIQSEMSRKPLFGLWLFITAGNQCHLGRTSVQVSHFCFRRWLKIVSETFSHFYCTLLSTQSWIEWKNAKNFSFSGKSCSRFGSDLYCFDFRCKHRFIIFFIVRWLYTFAKELLEQELDTWAFFLLLYRLSSSPYCCVDQIYKWRLMSKITVFHVVSKNISTFWKI